MKRVLTWGGAVLAVAAVQYVIAIGPWMTDEQRYALANGTDVGHVHADKKPKDCDWWVSPLGSKGCHYEKRTQLEPAEMGGLPSVYVTWEKVAE